MLLATVFLREISILFFMEFGVSIFQPRFHFSLSYEMNLLKDCRKKSLYQVIHIALNFMRFIQELMLIFDNAPKMQTT